MYNRYEPPRLGLAAPRFPRPVGPLLESGVEIHVCQRTMLQLKTLIADDHWLIIGSANFDTRSFLLNEKLDANVFDAELVRWRRHENNC